MNDRTYPTRLSASDSLMWRIESDPILRSPILVVGLLDRSPTPEGLEATIRRAAAVVPRLRQRIVGPPLDIGRPRWEDAGEVSLAHHVRRVRSVGGGLESALAVAEPDAVTAFDPARPPWTLTIVDGLDGDQAAMILRFHHAISDGVGGIEIAHLLFDTRRATPPVGTEAPSGAAASGTSGPASNGDRPADDRPASPTAATPPAGRPGPLDALGALGSSIAGTARGAGRLAAGAVQVAAGAARRPTATVTAPLRFGRSAARLMATSASGSPELVGRSLDRWLASTERPFDAFKRAARATDGTVNDVFLAAVAGALDDYHRRQGAPVRAVRVTMPISIRRSGDRLGGNRFTPARFTLPVDDPDPRARIAIAGAIVRRWRAEPAVASTSLLAAGLDLLPRPVVTRLFGDMLRTIDVDVVDVPGLDRAAFIGGARIDLLWAFAPPTGAALSITLVSHGGTGCVALACDRAAVADPALLARCLDEALDDVLALGRTAPKPRPASRSKARATARPKAPAAARPNTSRRAAAGRPA